MVWDTTVLTMYNLVIQSLTLRIILTVDPVQFDPPNPAMLCWGRVGLDRVRIVYDHNVNVC